MNYFLALAIHKTMNLNVCGLIINYTLVAIFRIIVVYIYDFNLLLETKIKDEIKGNRTNKK